MIEVVAGGTLQFNQDKDIEVITGVTIALSGITVAHWLSLAGWRLLWPKGERALPAFLAYLNPQLLILTFTIIPIAQTFGVLSSIKDPAAPPGYTL